MTAISRYANGRVTRLALAESAVVALVVAVGGLNPDLFGVVTADVSIAYVSLYFLFLIAAGAYDGLSDEPYCATANRILGANFAAVSTIALLAESIPGLSAAPAIVPVAAVSAIASLVLRAASARTDASRRRFRHIVVVGEPAEAADVAGQLHRHGGLAAHGIAEVVPLSQYVAVSPGDGPSVEAALQKVLSDGRAIEFVVAARERRAGAVPLGFLLRCKLHGRPVSDLATFCEREFGLIPVESLRASWLVLGGGFDQGRARTLVKRGFDLAASIALLAIALPAMACVALAVLVETGRPILFRQTRTGLHGAEFELWKFRSMHADAEADGVPRWASRADRRITRVGRLLRATRLDELPQLMNVLRGEMSFIGPRPERPVFVGQLREQIPFYDLRHSVKPGISGWAQVRLPYSASVEGAARKLEFDLYYVKQHSVAFDVAILVETLRVVLRRQGQ